MFPAFSWMFSLFRWRIGEKRENFNRSNLKFTQKLMSAHVWGQHTTECCKTLSGDDALNLGDSTSFSFHRTPNTFSTC